MAHLLLLIIAALLAFPAQAQSPVGEPRPAFALPDVEGKTRDIAEWDGRVILVNFLASWCPPCRRETPLLIEAQQQHAEWGLQIIGVAVEDADGARRFVERFQPPFPVLAGGLEGGINLGRAYGNQIGALPHSALIDRDGRVLKTWTGELTAPQLQSWLDEALRQ